MVLSLGLLSLDTVLLIGAGDGMRRPQRRRALCHTDGWLCVLLSIYQGDDFDASGLNGKGEE